MTISRRKFMWGTAALLAATQLKTRALAAAMASTGIKDVYKDDFFIGTAISNATLANQDQTMLDLIKREFSAITAENCMKWEPIRPQLDKWNWELADRFVDYGVNNKMYVVGHTLIWHSQAPAHIYLDAEGKPNTRDAQLKVMEEHIRTLAGRYKGKIDAWDVVNEAVEDDGSWRQTGWFKNCGEGYVAHAFKLAAETDPKPKLLYNDYNAAVPKKRDAIISLVKGVQKAGAPIHGVGMQGHMSLTHPEFDEFEKSIIEYAKLGVKVHITELDIDVLPLVWNLSAEISNRFEYRPEMDPYRDGLPAEKEEELAARYEALFKILLRHRDKIDRVTTWGTNDAETWLNGFPIPGRVNYPMLFDRNNQPKLAYHRLMQLKQKKN